MNILAVLTLIHKRNIPANRTATTGQNGCHGSVGRFLIGISIKQKWMDIKLKTKFNIIIMLAAVCIGLCAILSCQSMLVSYNKLLYEKSTVPLSALSSKIQTNLQAVADISQFIASNKTVQTNLNILNGASSQMEKSIAKQTIKEVITSYYSANKYIIVISLDTKDGLISYGKDSSAESPETQKKIKEITKQNSGKAYWLSTAREDSSALCVRMVKKIENLSLENLGLLTIRLDFTEMVDDFLNEMSQKNDTQIYVWNAESLVYPVNDKNGLKLKELLSTDHLYQILMVDGEKNFVVSKQISNPNWTFTATTRYNQVFHSTMIANLIFVLLIILITVLAIVISNALVQNIMKHFNTLIDKINSFKNDVPPVKKECFDYSNCHDELGVLHQEFDSMVQRINQLIEDNYVKQILIKDTQLKMLEQQIEPHFLFNTLESINWQAKANKEKQISLMVESLGTLLRYTVSEKADVVPISKELSIVEKYMYIQQIRFDDRLKFSSTADSDLLNVLIPKMSIQPLVENAIRYSLERITEDCTIEVSVVKDKENALILVKNNGSEIDCNILDKIEKKEVQPNGCGIGLTNINQRLKIIFGSNYGLSFENQTGWTVVTITVPILFPNKEDRDAEINHSG